MRNAPFTGLRNLRCVRLIRYPRYRQGISRAFAVTSPCKPMGKCPHRAPKEVPEADSHSAFWPPFHHPAGRAWWRTERAPGLTGRLSWRARLEKTVFEEETMRYHV